MAGESKWAIVIWLGSPSGQSFCFVSFVCAYVWSSCRVESGLNLEGNPSPAGYFLSSLVRVRWALVSYREL